MASMDDIDDPQPCCANLRCKSMTYREDERPGLLHVEDAMGYWCLLTNVPLGPDDDVASHRDCQPARECHKPAPQLKFAVE